MYATLKATKQLRPEQPRWAFLQLQFESFRVQLKPVSHVLNIRLKLGP
jgi:hypothetical protein